MARGREPAPRRRRPAPAGAMPTASARSACWSPASPAQLDDGAQPVDFMLRNTRHRRADRRIARCSWARRATRRRLTRRRNARSRFDAARGMPPRQPGTRAPLVLALVPLGLGWRMVLVIVVNVGMVCAALQHLPRRGRRPTGSTSATATTRCWRRRATGGAGLDAWRRVDRRARHPVLALTDRAGAPLRRRAVAGAGASGRWVRPRRPR